MEERPGPTSTDGEAVAHVGGADAGLWSRRPELILVWIVWALGPGFLGMTRLLGLFTRGDDGGPPDLGALEAFMFGHFTSALCTLGLLIARGPQRRLPEFWFVVAYWIPLVGVIRAESGDQSSVLLFGNPAVVLMAAVPAAGMIRALLRWSGGMRRGQTGRRR